MIRNITLTSIGHAACTIIRMILMLLMSLSDVNGNGLAAVIQFLEGYSGCVLGHFREAI